MPGTKNQQPENKVVGTKRGARSQTAPLVIKGHRKTGANRKRRMLNGIPLRRKVLWVYDTNSPEFKAARKRDLKASKSKDWDRDGMQWVEAVSNDPDWQKWWR